MLWFLDNESKKEYNKANTVQEQQQLSLVFFGVRGTLDRNLNKTNQQQCVLSGVG